MRTPLPAALSAILVLFAAASARATTIADFTFSEGSIYAIASSDADPNSTATFVLNGPLGSSVDGNPGPGLTVSLPFSNAGELYGSGIVQLTPAAGHELDLTSLSFDASQFLDASGISSATYLAAIRSNLDGFASDLGTFSWTALTSPPGFTNLSLDLTGAAFQGLDAAALAGVGGSLQLEFFFAMTSSPAIAGVNSVIDNVVVNGTTPAVPEPAAGVLLGAAALGCLARRRRAFALR